MPAVLVVSGMKDRSRCRYAWHNLTLLGFGDACIVLPSRLTSTDDAVRVRHPKDLATVTSFHICLQVVC